MNNQATIHVKTRMPGRALTTSNNESLAVKTNTLVSDLRLWLLRLSITR